MSVDVKDFRRFKEGQIANEAADRNEHSAPLLQQEATEVPETGIPEMDKLVRVLQANIEMAEQHLSMTAQAVVVQINADMRQKMTLEYMLAKGMLEAYKAIIQLPAAIIAESQPKHHA